MFRNPTTDLIVVLVIVLLILGPKRLPGLGKSLGTGMREFKDSITGDSKDDEEQHPAITRSSAPVRPSPRTSARATGAQLSNSASAGPGRADRELGRGRVRAQPVAVRRADAPRGTEPS